jgi:hypothetical protein
MRDTDSLLGEIESLVAAEHDETTFALLILAPAAIVLACERPALLWVPLQLALALVLRHMLTLQRVVSGRFGGNPAEAREILAHAARREH